MPAAAPAANAAPVLTPPLELPAGLPPEVEAIACDLDRTILARGAQLEPQLIEAIAAARERGIHVVIATGRMFRSVRPLALEAGLPGPVVCYQGALVAEAQSGRFLLHEPMSVEIAREAIEALAEEGYSPNVYVNDEMYVADHTAASNRYASTQSIGVREVGDLLDWLSEPPTKLVVVGDPDHLDEVKLRMRRRFDGRLFISKSLAYFLEFAAHGVTKGSGLAFVADSLGFALERTIAFGDGENDIELLDVAGFGVAVEDADPSLTPVTDWSVPPPEKLGVARAIEALLARA